MTLTRLKKMPTKAGVYFDPDSKCLVEIYKHLITKEWVIGDYPKNSSHIFLKPYMLEVIRLYGPLVLKG